MALDSEFSSPSVAVPTSGRATLLLTAESLAELLQVSKRTLWRLRSAGRLPRPIHLGGSVRWRADEVRLWIARGCPSLREWEAYRAGAEEQ